MVGRNPDPAMFVILDPPLDYSTRWETIGSICDRDPHAKMTGYLRLARRRANVGDMVLEMLSVHMTVATITAIFDPATRKVVAQVETMMQDGCVPPVHLIMAHAKPINPKYYEQN